MGTRGGFASHTRSSAPSILTLVFSGFMILLVHPRLYWGKAGNVLMPALIEFPFGARYPGTNWEPATPCFDRAGAPFTASRTVEPFNENGWARSLHFLAAWWLVVPGFIYLAVGIARGHLRRNIVPGTTHLAPNALWQDIADHLRLRIRRPVAHSTACCSGFRTRSSYLSRRRLSC